MRSIIITMITSFMMLTTISGQSQWEIVNRGAFCDRYIDSTMDWICLPLNDVHFIDQDKGYIVGGTYGSHWPIGVLYRTENGGENWKIIYEGNIGFPAILFINDSIGFMPSHEVFPGELYYSSDGGDNWNMNNTMNSVEDICFVNDSTGYTISISGNPRKEGLFKTNNWGKTWSIFHQFELDYTLNSIFFIDDNNGWVLCEIIWGGESQSNILKYSEEHGWNEILSGTDLPLNKILFVDHDVGWISGGYSNDDGFKPVFLRSVDGGETWAQTPGLDYLINDFYFENRTHGWAVGRNIDDRGIILETSNSGLDWEVVIDPLPVRLNALHFADGYGWAVGDNGLLLKTKYTSTSANRFMVVGDAHHYSPSPDFSQSLLYELTTAAIEEEVVFVFFTGDLGMQTFETPEEEDSVLKDWRFVLDTLYHHNIRVYACRGNVDVSGREAWDSLFSGIYAFPQNGPEMEKNLTYAIEYDNFLFLSLDQYTDSHKINQEWLDSLLTTNPLDHIFAAGHEPAFKLRNSNCMGVYPEERNLFWESLTDAGALAYFSGHDHFYDHTIMDDGDSNPDNDVHHVTSGTGGGSIFSDSEYDGDNGRWTPVRQFHEEENGYVLVQLNGDEVEMTWKHRIEPNVFEYGGDSYVFSTGTTSLKEIDQGNGDLMNYPNPFQTQTMISYHLQETSDVELSIYDLSGRKAATLIKESRSAGMHETEWNADHLEPGIYFCELKTGKGRQVIKMILIQ